MALKKTNLFPVAVTKLHLAETPALKEAFMPEMLRRYEENAYVKPSRWQTDRVHTSFDAERKDLVINFIDAMPEPYDNLLRQFVRADRFDLEFWHNVYWKKEEYQERHHHIPNHISFIHFFAFDKAEHRPPVFYDPARMIKRQLAHDSVEAEYWEDRAEIAVEEGDVLVFPSYLEHYVPPGKYTKPRITVSMNVKFKT